jgi:hypothetical protein
MRKECATDHTPEQATAAISAAHLLYPSRHFGHPRDVLAAADIPNEEKRAILASWASDIFSIESIPALRLYPGTDEAVSYDEIIQALKALDLEEGQSGEPGMSSLSGGCEPQGRRQKTRRLRRFGLYSPRKGGDRPQLFEI